MHAHAHLTNREIIATDKLLGTQQWRDFRFNLHFHDNKIRKLTQHMVFLSLFLFSFKMVLVLKVSSKKFAFEQSLGMPLINCKVENNTKPPHKLCLCCRTKGECVAFELCSMNLTNHTTRANYDFIRDFTPFLAHIKQSLMSEQEKLRWNRLHSEQYTSKKKVHARESKLYEKLWWRN